MKKFKYLIVTNLTIFLFIMYNVFSKIYIEFKGGTINFLRTYKVECGYANSVLDNTYLETASKNLSMLSDLCMNLARLRVLNIVLLSILLLSTSLYTYISYKKIEAFKPIDDLLRILKKRNYP